VRIKKTVLEQAASNHCGEAVVAMLEAAKQQLDCTLYNRLRDKAPIVTWLCNCVYTRGKLSEDDRRHFESLFVALHHEIAQQPSEHERALLMKAVREVGSGVEESERLLGRVVLITWRSTGSPEQRADEAIKELRTAMVAHSSEPNS